MQSFTVVVLVFGLVAVSLAQEKHKVCLKSTDACTGARELYINLKAIEVNDKKDIPVYIDQLHKLFSLTLTEDCKIDLCKCKETKLDCSQAKKDIHDILQNVKLPECLKESEKATTLLAKFKKAIADKDREAILSTLTELKAAINAALARDDNTAIIDCITKSILHIREAVQTRIGKLELQETCEFCT